MKTYVFRFLVLSFMLIIFFACKKKKAAQEEAPYSDEITYPTSMTFGSNVLVMDSVTKDQDYSFGANLGNNANLKIILSNLSIQTNTNAPKSVWFFSGSQGWTVSGYSNDTQTFTSNKSGEIVLNLNCSGSPGSCKVEFYENSTSVTRTKTLKWK